MSTALHTRNVTRVYRQATDDERAAGAAWYPEALAHAQRMATAYGVPVHVAAGVIAATSPLNSWAANLGLAERILSTGDTSRGYLKTGLKKARAILDGADPETVLGTTTGQKVWNFYRAIITGGRDGVCIDRHAYDIATNTRHDERARPGIQGQRYRAAAETYRRAAVILSREYGRPIAPAEVQAVTWTAWRRRYWAVGAFDPKGV